MDQHNSRKGWVVTSLIAVVEVGLEHYIPSRQFDIREYLYLKPTSTEMSALQERSRDFRRTKLFRAFPRWLIFSSNVPGRLRERISPVNISTYETVQHYFFIVLWFTASDG